MEYTAAWFRRNRHVWERHFHDLAYVPVRYLEVGVFEGYSLIWIMGRLLRHPDSRGVGIDWWGKMANPPDADAELIYQRAVRNVQKHDPARITLIRGRSDEVLPRLLANGERYDLILIDGSHKPHDAWLDSQYCWRLCRVGGVVVWDDHQRRNPIRPIVATFRKWVASKHEVFWETRRQLAVRKLEDWP